MISLSVSPLSPYFLALGLGGGGVFLSIFRSHKCIPGRSLLYA